MHSGPQLGRRGTGMQQWVKGRRNSTYEEAPAASSKFYTCLGWEKGSVGEVGETLQWQGGKNERKSTKPLIFKHSMRTDRKHILEWIPPGCRGRGKGYECFCCHQKDTKKTPTNDPWAHRIEGVSTPASNRISQLH